MTRDRDITIPWASLPAQDRVTRSRPGPSPERWRTVSIADNKPFGTVRAMDHNG